jgi:hypothetical protein
MTDAEAFDLLILEPSLNEGYLDEPIPSGRDEEISLPIAAAERDGRLRELAGHLSETHVSVLLAFAERMASLAIRLGDPGVMRRGLIAACLPIEVADRREVLLVLPLLWRTAERLGLDAVSEFTAVDRTVGCEELARFAARRPEDRTIESMGYVEARDDDGFRYERTW